MKIFLFLFFLFLYNIYQISFYKIERLSLTTDKTREGFRIIQISDFHSSRFINLERLMEDISDLNPDIIVFTGDIIDGRKKSIDKGLELLERLEGLGIDSYFVLGNHEYRNPNLKIFLDELRSRGVTILNNNFIRLSGKNINLGGVDFGLDKMKYDKLVDSMGDESYNILLSHSPKYPIDYSEGREDLIISGHTHGGQVRLAFLGALLSPSEGFLPYYDKGLYRLGESFLYIDSGLGNSLLPIRFLNRVQISLIDID